MKSVYLFLAPGFEEIEALTVVDLLRRAGISITTVSISDTLNITGAHNISVAADTLFSACDFSNGDMFILPGGAPGTCNLDAYNPLKEVLKKAYADGKYIGAICAAPMILGHLGFLEGRNATCYPGFEEHLYGANLIKDSVITDGSIITSRGLGTAIDFAGELIALLLDRRISDQIKQQIIYTKEKSLCLTE